MADRFETQADTLSLPARRAFSIAAHATAEIDPLPKAIYVGTGGDIVLRGVDSAVDVTFKSVPSGAILDVRAQYIRVAGTTASNLVGLA